MVKRKKAPQCDMGVSSCMCEKKMKTNKEIEKLEEEHMIFCGYKASECGCCSDLVENLKKEKSK